MTRVHRGLFLFVVLPFCVLGLGLGRTNAEPLRMRAVAMSCPASVSGPDCTRDTALEVATQPSTMTECPKVAQLLATYVGQRVDAYHKLGCERWKD